MIFLHGAILISNKTDGTQEQIPVHFVLVNGFPSIAPKAYLSKPPDPKLIKDNPFIMEGNEIMNQYMDKWEGFNPSYTLNMMFYYIYQSFLIHPPIGSGIKSEGGAEGMAMEPEPPREPSPPRHEDVSRRGDTMADPDIQKVMLQSKVEEKINDYFRNVQDSLQRVGQAQVALDQH